MVFCSLCVSCLEDLETDLLHIELYVLAFLGIGLVTEQTSFFYIYCKTTVSVEVVIRSLMSVEALLRTWESRVHTAKEISMPPRLDSKHKPLFFPQIMICGANLFSILFLMAFV